MDVYACDLHTGLSGHPAISRQPLCCPGIFASPFPVPSWSSKGAYNVSRELWQLVTAVHDAGDRLIFRDQQYRVTPGPLSVVFV